jgi:hypothetical protein
VDGKGGGEPLLGDHWTARVQIENSLFRGAAGILTRIRRMTMDFAVQFRHLWHSFHGVMLH